MPDMSPEGILVGILKYAGQKCVGDIGAQVAESVTKSTIRFLNSLNKKSSVQEAQKLGNILF